MTFVPGETRVATLACRASCRYSPCIGTKYCGLTSDEHELQLFLAAVARDMDVLRPLVDDVRAAARNVVHDAADGLLVPRYRPRRKHHHVVPLEPHLPVIVDGDPRQRRLRLTLRPRAQADHVLRGEVPHFAVANLNPARDAQVPQPLRNLRVLLHPATDERDVPIELRREIDDDLHPVDARRKRRDDDLSAGAREDLLERLDRPRSPSR